MLYFTDDSHFCHYNTVVEIILAKIRQLSKDRCFFHTLLQVGHFSRHQIKIEKQCFG